MTTENLDIPDELEAQLGILGNEARNRANRIQTDRRGKRVAQRNLVVGASVLVQRKQDEIAALDEEQAQMEDIQRRAALLLPPDTEPAAEPDVPVSDQGNGDDVLDDFDEEEFVNGLYTRSDLNGMTNQRLQLLAGAYNMDLPIDAFERGVAISRIIRAQSRWCLDNDEVDPNNDTRTRVHRIVRYVDVRTWSAAQWIGALIGLVVAVLVWTIWPEWPGRNIKNDFVQNLVNFAWFLGHAGIGFFGGAQICASIFRSRQQN